jgi:hypothetical protein
MSSSAIRLKVADRSRLTHLDAYLSWAAPEVGARQVARHAGAGELGAPDLARVLADVSGGAVAAIRVLSAFPRSRRSSVEIITTVKGNPGETSE